MRYLTKDTIRMSILLLKLGKSADSIFSFLKTDLAIGSRMKNSISKNAIKKSTREILKMVTSKNRPSGLKCWVIERISAINTKGIT